MKQQQISRLLLLLMTTMISATAQAQTKNGKLLDVYQIDFDYYVKSIDTSRVSEVPMIAEMRRIDNANQTLLRVYAHPKYLYAKHCGVNNEEPEVWLVNYKSSKLFQLLKKIALPLDFGDYMRTNVLLPNESFSERWKAHGRITFTNDTMTVAGYRCKRAIINYTPDAIRPGDTKLERTVWYCPELPKFYFPSFEYLQKIPGMALMIYEDRGYNLIEGYEARSVVKQQKPVSFFDVPKEINVLYPPKIN